MSLIVQKFGGTSVADTHHVLNVAKKVISFYKKGHDVIVVVSAQGDTTDKLIEKVKKISANPSLREMDALISTGEQVSASLLALAIESFGVSAISLTGWQAGFKTNLNYGNADIEMIDTERIKKELDKKNIVVITGFQGINSYNDITTLGRGGSDTSAVAIAGAMKASVCKIYTDVDGVYTADPRIVPSARKLDKLSYEEMFKLSSLGAQVLNDVSIKTAQKYGVEIEVLSSMKNDTVSGSIIKNIPKSEINSVSGIAIENKVAKVIVENVENKKEILNILMKNNLVNDSELSTTLQQSPDSLTFITNESKIDRTLEILKSVDSKGQLNIFYEKNKSKVSVVNLSDSFNINIASIVFETLHEANINIEMAVCDSARTTVIVDEENLYRCVGKIHSKLFEEDYLI